MIPKVAPASICGVRTPEITKQDQRKEHCIEAALFELDQKTCILFNRYGISRYFETLRACLRNFFAFADYIRITISDSLAKYSVPSFCAQLPNKPVARGLQRLQEAFVAWEREPTRYALFFHSCLMPQPLRATRLGRLDALFLRGRTWTHISSTLEVPTQSSYSSLIAVQCHMPLLLFLELQPTILILFLSDVCRSLCNLSMKLRH